MFDKMSESEYKAIKEVLELKRENDELANRIYGRTYSSCEDTKAKEIEEKKHKKSGFLTIHISEGKARKTNEKYEDTRTQATKEKKHKKPFGCYLGFHKWDEDNIKKELERLWSSDERYTRKIKVECLGCGKEEERWFEREKDDYGGGSGPGPP
jgi:hypothetical protein